MVMLAYMTFVLPTLLYVNPFFSILDASKR